MKTDITGSIFGPARISSRIALRGALLLWLAANPLRAADPLVVSGEPGTASKRDVADYSSLARQEAIFPPLIKAAPKSSRSLRPYLKEPGELPVPAGAQPAALIPAARQSAPSRPALRGNPAGSLASASLAAPPPPPPSPPPLPSPPASASFQALTDDGTLWEPDAQGAVGPNHLMVTLNTQVRIQDRNGGTISTVSLQNFWSMPGISNAVDPRVL